MNIQEKRVKMRKSRMITVFVLCASICVSSFSEEKGRTADFVKADRYTSDSLFRLMRNYDITPQWVDENGRYCYYTVDEPLQGGGFHTLYRLLDTRSGKSRLLFDAERLHILLKPFVDKSKRPFGDKIHLNLVRMEKKDSRHLYFSYRNKRFVYDLTRETLAETEEEKEKEKAPFTRQEYWKDYSADSLYYIYADSHNLYLCRTATGDTLQLTSDGEHYYSYATGGNSVNDKGRRASGVGLWVGDTHQYLWVREDKRRVGTLSLVDNLAGPRPKVTEYKFAMPGDKEVVQYSAGIVDADSARAYPLDITAYPDQIIDVPRFKNFEQSGEYLYFIRKSRTQDQVDLCRVDVRDRSMTVLIHEECRPHLNEQLFSFHVLNGGRDILWWSERDGHGRIYLYDGEGRLKNAVTPEDGVAGLVERIDTVGRSIIYHGYGREKGALPDYRYYYKVGFDGRGLTCLTPDNGNHEVRFSPNGMMLTDHCSRMDMPPVHSIYDMKGRLVARLGRCNVDSLHARGWREPEVMQVWAADSVTPLYGIVYKPFDMQPSRRYPIISNVYPGPHTDLVPLSFTLDDNGNQSLAQLGFIVINFSYRGSNPYRGRDFYTYGYGNLRDYALADDKAVIRQVAERIPEADTTRVGIYGHSGGGFMTTAAMLTSPDFYKVGVAASGNHDNNIYSQWWGETFHGVTQQTDSTGHVTFSCRIPTNMELAPNLKGRLLLITGDVDNNVHPASTMRMANAFIKAGKRFDMAVMPGVDHGVGGAWYQNMIRYYFVEHLLGERSEDIDIVKHQ